VHPALFQSACLTADFGDEKKDESNGASRFFGAPKSVFIGGGGELATAREVLRHKSVSRVVMVDLDGDLVNICREYLPEWGGETVMSDPRFELVIGDCYEYLLNCTEKFDAIIMDISDPIEAGPGIMLYTQELYSHAKSLLTENGVFVTQAGAADAIPAQKDLEGTSETCCFGPIANTLATVFNCVLPYTVCIPSYGSDWGFVMAFNSPDPFSSMCEMMNMPINQIDNMISSRIAPTNHISNSNDKDDSELLEHYDGIAHHRMFSLPKKIRKCLDNEKRIMTKDNPVFMY
jgi:spermidine synthase